MTKNMLATTALFVCLTANTANAQAQPSVLEQLRFLSVEYLIYTDQLQKLDATPCGASAASPHNLEAARRWLLDRLREEHRAGFEALFQSPQVQQLLEENSRGIASLLGAPGLVGLNQSLNERQRQACQEFSLVFQDNLAATREELDTLLKAYGGL
ncbi:hypothetical protein [Motiliproteus sp. SC1-56]|uniref:hypothetical protein n=1 Tax=Motiliproteus sp. SC1-56 TaxID=2799565 RepID=UPI001A8E3E61|nr:hypothetical protein [Motiliproteus sp. SC1-56]